MEEFVAKKRVKIIEDDLEEEVLDVDGRGVRECDEVIELD